jgi:hypothetical protein
MQDHPKTRFWDAVFRAAEGRLHEPWFFIGDFNTARTAWMKRAGRLSASITRM